MTKPTELQTLLDRAYSNLSKLTVSGEAVILVACVMQDLKDAFKITTELNKKDEVTEDG
jgi:hypothetical protein